MVYWLVSLPAVVLGTLALRAMPPTLERQPPTFEAYKTPVANIHKSHVKIQSHPVGKKFRIVIRETVASKGINFAGQFTLVEWGCGTNCTRFAIVDLKTGQISYDPDLMSTFRGLDFRRDSALLVVDPPSDDCDLDPTWPTRYYLWKDGRLKLVSVRPGEGRTTACSGRGEPRR